MLEHLNAYFTSVHRLRRSERALVRAGAAMELEELQSRAIHPKMRARINEALNHHKIAKAKAG